jgi:methionyl-tRNA formyltransferase
MKIVFMGTPEFAIPSLEKIIQSQHQVVGVVTGMDKPVGRGLRIRPTPIKRVAECHELPVLTPVNLKDESFIEALKQWQADLFVIVAFRILPVSVFTIPSKGAINLHGSLLPKYRGAAPINWAIINGETETGVTTFFLNEKVDTGEMILRRKIPIGTGETAGELHDRMSTIGAEVLFETVDLIEKGKAIPQRQEGETNLAPKITKKVCHIDWSKDARSIVNLIRGLSPYPRAFSYLNGKEYKICRAEIESEFSTPDQIPGQIVGLDKKCKILVATGEGIVSINSLQPECKCQMTTEEFLRGYTIEMGEVLT